ncbi:MAG: hypothetical protein EOO88_30860, partial [Pedobacter sp.]
GYNYTLDNGTVPQPSNLFTGVAAGPHTVTVTFGSCTTTINVNVPPPAPLTPTGTTTPSGCSASGTITITPGTGAGAGVPPYTYQLGSGTAQASGTFTAVAAGNYVVTVTDATGCTGTVNVTVGNRAALSGTAVATPSGCQPSGTITLTPTGGTAPFTYSLDGISFLPSNVFNPVGAGTYAITIKDSTGCTFNVTNIVVAGTSVSASAVSTPSACNPSGTVTVTATSGTAPYTYQLGSNAAQASNIFSSLATGSYVITVKDALSCVATVNVNVGALNPLLASAVTTPSGCVPANGTIDAQNQILKRYLLLSYAYRFSKIITKK